MSVWLEMQHYKMSIFCANDCKQFDVCLDMQQTHTRDAISSLVKITNQAHLHPIGTTNCSPYISLNLNAFVSDIETLWRTKMSILGKVRNWNNLRQTRRQLTALTTRQLDDIGITRSGIDAVVRNPISAN
jgi:uncharacterized protein YjiS (DUF1127 family)